jgi:hypothetical protein
MQIYQISIDDPIFFKAPDGSNKILAKGLGLVYGSPSFQIPKEAYLLEVNSPFIVDGEEVNYLLVTPRYVGDTLDKIMKSEGVVNISRVKPGIILRAGDEYGGFDFEPWALGYIT